MNKYLLLRDNKQSGPFTVPEIIDFGIKPYDLVWLDGKSAAWLYPSEIEELKAYAPTVEEQPFDRFYKTREAIISQQPAVEQHSPYEPKPIEVEQIAMAKKVYINFPVSTKPEIPVATKPEVKKVQPPAPAPTFTERTQELTRPAERLSVSTQNAPERKYFAYAAIAACVLLLGFITLLLVNNNSQKEKLKELNTIVKEIQNKNNTAGLAETPVANVEPAQSSETIINPELLKMSENESVPVAAKETAKPVAVTIEELAKTPAPTITANGNEGRPVIRRSETDTKSTPAENKTVSADAAATDNLFKQVNIQPGKYKVGMLGGISNLTLALTNNSQRELHKVVVEIKFLGPEKKIVNTQTVYFENVAAGAQSTIDVPKSKRGVSIDYIITDIKS